MIFFVFSSLLFALASSSYELKKSYEGDNFFNGFYFLTKNDPSNGFVDYVDRQTAENLGLISFNDTKIKISTDSTNKIPTEKRGRPSIKIQSSETYNEGLFIFDIEHMPEGLGTWPAYWFYGDDWPNNGEVDVVEGVGEIPKIKYNNFALHTTEGCKMREEDQDLFTGKWFYRNGKARTNCHYIEDQIPHEGCPIRSPDGFFGEEFNKDKGGVIIYEWERNDYMRFWMFKRNQIPIDIIQGKPNPSNWGKPMAYYRLGANCSPDHFNDMMIVININFCGAWAGDAYPGGQEACINGVRNNPGDFTEAYWTINYLKVYKH